MKFLILRSGQLFCSDGYEPNLSWSFLQSVKFYYNPLNGLFEPIAFDGHRFKHNYNKYHLNYDNRLLFDFVRRA